ncbi:hypothetical protein [Nitrosomonas oligotropha]|uniref:hypothetical protein n=1 Tax=Nitrosomonas oligotropha TaxID=42354 RepID=UPI00136C016E|nr:hypothetical protein [Nitrosomonas oligotropha]MXS82713.1 hypothetical protein [Nitrosomonas oligotropha]
MRGYFSIDIRDEENDGPILDYRFLFKSQGIVSPADLADCLTQALRRALFPDAIIFVCIPSEFAQLAESFKTSDGVKQALERASSKVCVAICKLDMSGSLGKPECVKNHHSSFPLIEKKHKEKIFREGLRKLFDTPKVLIPAPAGFIFVKPSKNRSKYFLRAEEAFHETERVHFLAYTILSKIAEREKETQESIEVIFVDTMGIASLAYVLRELYHEFYERPRPRVESFHSYGGIKKIPIPLRGTSFCIISASSSMAMQRDWRELTRCFPSEVVTLVTFRNAKDSEQAIYAFDSVNSNNNFENQSGLRDLRIVGESFTHEDVPLKSVLLRASVHRQKKWFELGPKYSCLKLFSLMKAGEILSKTRPIFVEGEKLLECDIFKNFLKKEIMQSVPLSVQAIVHQDDKDSRKLAEICAFRIREIREEKETIKVISANDLENNSCHLNEEKALLIVAAVIGRGTKLLSISRSLRDIHIGARHYMIGFQLTESINDCVQLKNNLKFSAINSVINISIMESLAIGRTVEDTYHAELKIFSSNDLTSFPCLKDRIDELRQKKGVKQNAFLPATLHSEKDLKLRKDFAFWNEDYDEELDHSVAVLLTAALILQHAREFNKFEDDTHRLASDTFQQVVLDPENFTRYNDGVIQAALLRAAHPSELDYSSHEEVSRRMTDILSGIFRMNSRQQGEAALEFAFALRTERLKLCDSDIERLKQEINSLSNESGEKYVVLLKNLMDMDTPEVSEKSI